MEELSQYLKKGFDRWVGYVMGLCMDEVHDLGTYCLK